MFKKKTSTLSPATLMDDDARKAAALKEIKTHMIKFVVVKVAVTAAIGIAAGIAIKVLEAGTEDIIED
jgi:hypothetical protein